MILAGSEVVCMILVYSECVCMILVVKVCKFFMDFASRSLAAVLMIGRLLDRCDVCLLLIGDTYSSSGCFTAALTG